ncbi:hypothetical protein PVAG01_04672 [Phlyctema vagabunda]|uniref:Uncharacterized protein n=1 Tax=Phlyctema vagabunda TaxID=108571 RepID=A0ABR4PHW9_9HELO
MPPLDSMVVHLTNYTYKPDNIAWTAPSSFEIRESLQQHMPLFIQNEISYIVAAVVLVFLIICVDCYKRKQRRRLLTTANDAILYNELEKVGF